MAELDEVSKLDWLGCNTQHVLSVAPSVAPGAVKMWGFSNQTQTHLHHHLNQLSTLAFLSSTPPIIFNNYNHRKAMKNPTAFVVAAAANYNVENGSSAVVAKGSGTTARGRRLLKVREEKRKREYDRLHKYPSWAKVLEDACKDDDELRAVLGDSIGDPELMRKRSKVMGITIDGSLSVYFNPLDSFIWFELYGSPADRDVDLIGSIIQSWYVMGRLGAFNSSNMQLANSSMEYDPLYDAEKGFNVMPSSFHDISDVEFQDNWGRVWVDLGTSDYFAVDVLLNCLTVLSSEYLGIQQIVFGGRRIGDWEEGMTDPEFGYKYFKI
ncbi:hypothetical protein EZV62_018761 [Acer yangbiense]|uniref:Uncharacterized protein n=1 Tax=Acer yangbiense TaxID=1000413 RepID=A0A5C7HKS1_9ROSI|nr:hypothetical protein EZV62_018761 [Acer yangbiense]